MADAIEGLTPPLVWKYFAALSRIPRCSKHEQNAAKFVLDTAKKLGLQARQDRAGNVVVRKPASAGGLYTVRPGDTLSAIARTKDVPGGWQNLYRINKKTIGSNPGLIFPGQKLRLG